MAGPLFSLSVEDSFAWADDIWPECMVAIKALVSRGF